MTDQIETIEGSALTWLTRVNDPGFDRWDDWQAWLAQDPRHEAAYWRFAALEAEAVEAMKADAAARPPILRPLRKPVSPRFSSRVRRAVAAVFVAALVGSGWLAWSGRSQPWSVETAPGEQRSLVLADGTRLHLAGDSRVALDRRHPRQARLDSGRALFEVVHDEARPFSVSVGDVVLSDLGTVFDVTRLQDGARVAVSEGVVRVDANGRAATLQAGDGVVATADGLDRRPVPVGAVAAWREGRLVYDDERFAVIAEDLTRALGRPVAVAPDMADRRFTGSLAVTGSAEGLRRRLELLLDARIVPVAAGWRIEARSGG